MPKVDRRNALKMLGLGLVTAGSGAALAPRSAKAAVASALQQKSAIPAPTTTGATPALVGPYNVGSRVAASKIVAVSNTETGAVSVDFETDSGSRFRVDICRRDDANDAPAPVARTAHHDFFLANGGRGDKKTDRVQGLAVYALAWAVERNASLTGGPALLTMRERWARFHPAQVCSSIG